MRRFCFFLLGSLSIVAVNSQTSLQFCFKPMHYNGVGITGPRGITSGDFNGDGKIDLVAVNQSANNISVLMGAGTGSFSFAKNYSVGANPWGVASADFNSDGSPDLAVANENDVNITILLNLGTGTFVVTSNYALAGSPREIITADFNGDGNADLATAYIGGNHVGVLLGTGTGSFGATTNYPVGSSPFGIISRDFNGDGNLDIATANSGGNNISVLLGTGSGSFSSATNFPVGNSPAGITSADFNGDGNPDLAVANFAPFGGSNIAVLLGTGTGGFGMATYFNAGTNMNVLTSEDFNGDGNPDLAALDFGGGTLYLLRGTSSGSFALAKNFPHAKGSGIISADLNGDGKPDLASTYSSGHNVWVLLNEPEPTITITGDKNNLCSGEPITFTASGASSYAWDSNGVQTHTNFPAINNHMFIASTTATYAVTGISSVTGCSATAIAQVSISACTGLDSIKEPRPFKFFPNPAINEITFDLSSQENITIEIYNLSGQMVLRSENCSGIQTYDISSLSDAIYIYRVVNKNYFYSGRFYKICN